MSDDEPISDADLQELNDTLSRTYDLAERGLIVARRSDLIGEVSPNGSVRVIWWPNGAGGEMDCRACRQGHVGPDVEAIRRAWEEHRDHVVPPPPPTEAEVAQAYLNDTDAPTGEGLVEALHDADRARRSGTLVYTHSDPGGARVFLDLDAEEVAHVLRVGGNLRQLDPADLTVSGRLDLKLADMIEASRD